MKELTPSEHTSQFLAVLLKSPKAEKPDWSATQSFLLNEDEKVFPAGCVRFTNTSQEVIAVEIEGDKAFAIQPGKSVIRNRPQGRSRLAVASKGEDGKWKQFFRNGVILKEGERCSFFIYRGNQSKMKFYHYNDLVEKPSKKGP